MEEERNAKSANPSIDNQVGHRIGTAAWLSTNLGSIGDSPDLPAQSESKTPHETSRFQTPGGESHATDNAVLKDLLRLVQHLSARLDNESKVSADREIQDRSRFATIEQQLRDREAAATPISPSSRQCSILLAARQWRRRPPRQQPSLGSLP